MAVSSFVAPPPPNPDTLQNPPPFAPFPLTQLRSGRIKAALGPTRSITTGIFKTPLTGPVEITKSGIPSDEHAYEPHRGPDKALLQYCTRHYEDWKKELPASERFFKPGAFGENFFSDAVDEKVLCIGDKIAVGEVILELTEPRAPCFKLNHRFEVKDMAKRTQTLFRTGWLYRVLQPGVVNAGDMVRLLERPYPEWTVARVMYYLFIETDNKDMMRQLTELPPLGDEIKQKFKARLAKGETENQNDRMFGDESVKMETWSEYRIIKKREETSRVAAFVLESVGEIKDKDVMPVLPGSHVRLKLGGKLVRAYSVVDGSSRRFTLGVALEPESRGGSKFLHEQTKVGDVLTVGPITASFPLAKDADNHIIIAGGIGITAFITAAKHLQATRQNFHLHYAVVEEVPFENDVLALGPNKTIYNKALGKRMDLSSIISHANSKTHIYCCGSQRLTDAVKATATKYGVPDSSLHFEQFTVTTSGDPFTVELKESKKVVEVGATQTLLDVLKAVGLDVDSSCEVGNCGACRVEVCGGRVVHQGTALLEEEKGIAMLSCVSRGVGRIVLDL